MVDKLAIITAVFGDYDHLITPIYENELKRSHRFYCFTDNKNLKSDLFDIIYVKAPYRDPQRSARFFKIVGFQSYLRNSEFILWIDANYEIKIKSFVDLISNYEDSDITVIRHSDRNCLYDEGDWVIRAKRDNPRKVKKQLSKISLAGFPRNYGLSATGFLLRKMSHNTREFNAMWWKIVKKGSKRDQLSFDFCRWTMKDKVQFSFLNLSWRENEFVVLNSHLKLYESKHNYNFTNSLVGTLEGNIRSIILQLKDIVKSVIPFGIVNYRRKKRLDYLPIDYLQFEIAKLKSYDRFLPGETKLLGEAIKFTDSASFLFMYHEIIENEIYKFFSVKPNPRILDCGANIGLSIIYFKQLFPQAKIIGFEPDDKIFEALRYNINAFRLKDIELIKKACWNSETTLRFYSEGADGGRSALESDKENIIEVRATRLRNYLSEKVDFLKMDIEGAEFEVLHDIRDSLHNIERIFVEYHSFVGKEQKLAEIISILKTAGFRLHISSPGLASQHPFVKLNTYNDMDNQLNIYGFRQ